MKNRGQFLRFIADSSWPLTGSLNYKARWGLPFTDGLERLFLTPALLRPELNIGHVNKVHNENSVPRVLLKYQLTLLYYIQHQFIV